MTAHDEMMSLIRVIFATAGSVGGAGIAWLDHVQGLVSIFAGVFSIASACYAIAVARKTLRRNSEQNTSKSDAKD